VLRKADRNPKHHPHSGYPRRGLMWGFDLAPNKVHIFGSSAHAIGSSSRPVGNHRVLILASNIAHGFEKQVCLEKT